MRPSQLLSGDSGLKLTAFVLQDTLDSHSLGLGYVISTGRRGSRLVLDPRFFTVQIHDEEGRDVPTAVVNWTGSLGDAAIVLPMGGFVGRTFSLACARLGVNQTTECDRIFSPLHTGRYVAVVRYEQPAPPDSVALPRGRAVVDSVSFFFVTPRAP